MGSCTSSGRSGAAVAGVLAATVATVLGSVKVGGGERQYEVWGLLLLIFGPVVLGLSLAAISEWDSRRRFVRGDRQAQIRRLSKALQEAVRTINTISEEIESGDRRRSKAATVCLRS
jgi:hypothetical protein